MKKKLCLIVNFYYYSEYKFDNPFEVTKDMIEDFERLGYIIIRYV